MQWYLIEHLSPLLNVERRNWDQAQERYYEGLLAELLAQSLVKAGQIKGVTIGAGVYVLYHAQSLRDYQEEGT